MTAHDWQPVPERSSSTRSLSRCTICGAYRVRVRTEDGKRIAFTRYSPPDANIDDTLPWRWEGPGCKQRTEEPQS